MPGVERCSGAETLLHRLRWTAGAPASNRAEAPCVAMRPSDTVVSHEVCKVREAEQLRRRDLSGRLGAGARTGFSNTGVNAVRSRTISPSCARCWSRQPTGGRRRRAWRQPRHCGGRTSPRCCVAGASAPHRPAGRGAGGRSAGPLAERGARQPGPAPVRSPRLQTRGRERWRVDARGPARRRALSRGRGQLQATGRDARAVIPSAIGRARARPPWDDDTGQRRPASEATWQT
jgi:hypothetical protein